MRYLLDTNVLSEPTRKMPNQQTLQNMQRYQHEITTASPVLHELWFGWCRMSPSRSRDELKRYLVSLASAGKA